MHRARKPVTRLQAIVTDLRIMRLKPCYKLYPTTPGVSPIHRMACQAEIKDWASDFSCLESCLTGLFHTFAGGRSVFVRDILKIKRRYVFFLCVRSLRTFKQWKQEVM